MKTLIVKTEPTLRKWWLIDMKDQRLGGVAIKVADILRGKNKPIFSPHVDNGDNIVVINASDMSFSGRKLTQKKYYSYSGYPGGLSETTLSEMMTQNPEKVFRLAVRRMLPKNKLARKQLKKLHVYAGAEHPHQGQKPEKLELTK